MHIKEIEMVITRGVLELITANDIKDGVLTVPDKVKIIGKDAGSSLKELKKIVLSNSTTKIDDYAFYDCTNLEEIQFANNLQSIGESCFECCSSIKTLNLPSSLKVIGKSAFYDCKNLEKINFEEGLERIQGNAFERCRKITSLELPESLKVVEENAFKNCSGIVSVCANIKTKFDKDEFKCCRLKKYNLQSNFNLENKII